MRTGLRGKLSPVFCMWLQLRGALVAFSRLGGAAAATSLLDGSVGPAMYTPACPPPRRQHGRLLALAASKALLLGCCQPYVPTLTYAWSPLLPCRQYGPSLALPLRTIALWLLMH